jgi:hypothetical protein
MSGAMVTSQGSLTELPHECVQGGSADVRIEDAWRYNRSPALVGGVASPCQRLRRYNTMSISRSPWMFVAAYLLLLKDGKVLLLRRHNTGYEDGNYGTVRK